MDFDFQFTYTVDSLTVEYGYIIKGETLLEYYRGPGYTRYTMVSHSNVESFLMTYGSHFHEVFRKAYNGYLAEKEIFGTDN